MDILRLDDIIDIFEIEQNIVSKNSLYKRMREVREKERSEEQKRESGGNGEN